MTSSKPGKWRTRDARPAAVPSPASSARAEGIAASAQGAITGASLYHEQTIEVVPKLEAEQAIDRARADERKRLIALAPHEISCLCGQGGTFEWTAHGETCPRRQIGGMLTDLSSNTETEGVAK